MAEQALDTIYTADEAAARLRLTKRALVKIARKSGHCSRSGRTYLFSETDLLAIWQDMREPAVERRPAAPVTPVPSPFGIEEELRWLFGPPISVDRRVLGILRWLDRQKQPKSHKDIDRAGPRTIELLLGKGFVQQIGVSTDGLKLVKIAPEGRDQINIYERWKKKNAHQGR